MLICLGRVPFMDMTGNYVNSLAQAAQRCSAPVGEAAGNASR
jgi:hypothetical protein